MANYTIELGTLVQMGYPLNLDNYPIFNEEYREALNDKIIGHFWFREIGVETPDRFNFYLGQKMAEIMPLYNQMYQSELIKFDPLATVYFQTEQHGETLGAAGMQTKGKATEDAKTNDTFTGNRDTVGSQIFGADHTGNQLTTTDMQTDTTSEAEGKGTTDGKTHNDGQTTSNTTTSKTQVFNDVPQSGLNINIAPDGTTNISGYATTITTDNGNEKNTGTSRDDGTNHVDTDTEETAHSLAKTTGTVNVDDTARDDSNTDTTGNEQEQTERNTKGHTLAKNEGETKSQSRANTENKAFQKGRMGVSPADLIQKYRETFLNVDMLIIGELDILFMGVY